MEGDKLFVNDINSRQTTADNALLLSLILCSTWCVFTWFYNSTFCQILDVYVDKNDMEKIRDSIIHAVRPNWKPEDILEKVGD